MRLQSSTQGRKKQVLLNSVFGLLASGVSLVSAYAVRVFMVNSLGDELFGINSLFYSIANAMLILELGISTAIVIFLYKPMAAKNTEKIKSIVRFYRDTYRWFAAILLIISILFDVFFLKYFVHSNVRMMDVQLFFLIYMLGIALKYAFGYKRCMLFASQQNRINAIVTAIVEAVFSALEILAIVCYKSYYFFLIVFFFQNLVSNLACNYIVNKMYPFIKERNVKRLEKQQTAEIFKVIKPMFVQRVSNQINNSSSTIILGGYASVKLVGKYSNYLIIVHAIQTVLNQVSNSFTTSFGNYAAENDDLNNQYRIYSKARFYIYSFAAIVSLGFFAAADSFINILFGIEYVLESTTLIFISLYLYLSLASLMDIAVQNSRGLHSLDSKMMVAQTVATVVLSIVGGKMFDLNGILIGNIIPILVFSYINKYAVIQDRYFMTARKINITTLLREALSYLSAFALFVALTYLTRIEAVDNSYLKLLISGSLSVFCSVVSIAIFFARTEAFKECKGLITERIKRR